MCDCYEHKCHFCNNTIPMHIADFDYPRKAFLVCCNEHVDKAPVGSILFELLKCDPGTGRKAGWKCAIAGPEVRDGNHPNVAGDWEETVVGLKEMLGK